MGWKAPSSSIRTVSNWGKLAETLRSWTKLNVTYCKLGTYWVVNSLAEEDLCVPVDKPNIIQQRVLAEEKNNCMLGYMRSNAASKPKQFFSATKNAASKVLCPDWCSPVLEKHWHRGTSQCKAIKVFRWPEHKMYKERLSQLCLSLQKREDGRELFSTT